MAADGRDGRRQKGAEAAEDVAREQERARQYVLGVRKEEQAKRAAIAQNLAAFHAEVDARAEDIYAKQSAAFWGGAERVAQGADALANAMDAGDDAAIDAALRAMLKGTDAKPESGE